MKRKTYNNVLKVGRLIQAKGYSEKESLEIAVQKFDELASLKNGMSVEERQKTVKQSSLMQENCLNRGRKSC